MFTQTPNAHQCKACSSAPSTVRQSNNCGEAGNRLILGERTNVYGKDGGTGAEGTKESKSGEIKRKRVKVDNDDLVVDAVE